MRTLCWVRQLKHKTQPHSNTCLGFTLRLALLHLTGGCWALGSHPVCWNLLRISAGWVSSKSDKVLKQSHAVCWVRLQAWASKSYQVMPTTTSPFSPGAWPGILEQISIYGFGWEEQWAFQVSLIHETICRSIRKENPNCRHQKGAAESCSECFRFCSLPQLLTCKMKP